MGEVKNWAEIINNAWETKLSLSYKYNTVVGWGVCIYSTLYDKYSFTEVAQQNLLIKSD